jgi:hypothetical protein
MDKLLLEQVILEVLRFSPVSVIPSVFHTHIHFNACVNRTSGTRRQSANKADIGELLKQPAQR